MSISAGNEQNLTRAVLMSLIWMVFHLADMMLNFAMAPEDSLMFLLTALAVLLFIGNEYLARAESHLNTHLATIKQDKFIVPERKQKRSKVRNRAGFVYLVKSPFGYKIGLTTKPSKRLKDFEVNLPFETTLEHIVKCDDRFAMERALHFIFADKRMGNTEFFTLNDDDVEYFKTWVVGSTNADQV